MSIALTDQASYIIMPPKTLITLNQINVLALAANSERGDVMHFARARDGENTAIISEADLLASRRAFVADDHQEMTRCLDMAR